MKERKVLHGNAAKVDQATDAVPFNVHNLPVDAKTGKVESPKQKSQAKNKR